jgi:ComF family protein
MMNTKSNVPGGLPGMHNTKPVHEVGSAIAAMRWRARGMLHACLSAVQDVVFPPRCLGCGSSVDAADVLCPHCLTGLLPLPLSMDDSRLHLSSLTFPSDASMMFVGYEHESGGALEACIHAMKYQGMHRTGVWLGRLLGERLHGIPLVQGSPLLVPVPLHKVKQFERGYNQAEMLCRGLAAECELEHFPGLLARRRYTISQSAARLHRDQRRGNMLDAFAVDESLAATLQARPVVIVDDLVTTGATMGECAAALTVHGFRDIRYLALSRPAMRSVKEDKQRNRKRGSNGG